MPTSAERSARGRSARRRGREYEREVEVCLLGLGLEVERRPRHGGRAGSDMWVHANGLTIAVEVKAHKTQAVRSWLAQAEAQAAHGELAAVIYRRWGTKHRERDHVAMRPAAACSLGSGIKVARMSPAIRERHSPVIGSDWVLDGGEAHVSVIRWAEMLLDPRWRLVNTRRPPLR